MIRNRSTVQSHKQRGDGYGAISQILGLDIHAETIAVTSVEADREMRSLGTIANRAKSIRKLIKKLSMAEQLCTDNEASPTICALYRQLTDPCVAREVIVSTLVSVKAGDRLETDRRDAGRLARRYRTGYLILVWVPDQDSAALRDLVRARDTAKQDLVSMLWSLASRQPSWRSCGGLLPRNIRKRSCVHRAIEDAQADPPS